MPGERPSLEPPFQERPGEFIKAGAEAVVRELGEDYVLKTLHQRGNTGDAERMRAQLRGHQASYRAIERAMPGRAAKSLFVQGPDEDGRVRNYIAQERIAGPRVADTDLSERVRRSPDFRRELVTFGREVGLFLRSEGKAPELSGVNVLIDERSTPPRLRIVDFGFTSNIAEEGDPLGAPDLVADVYDDRMRMFEQEVERGDGVGTPPWEMFSSINHAHGTARRIVDVALKPLFDGQKPALWQYPVDEYIRKHTAELRRMSKQAKSFDGFIRAVREQYGQAIMLALEQDEFGFTVQDSGLQRRLARALLRATV